MIICEVHQLNDVALDTDERFAERLGTQLDVDRAAYLLADPKCVVNEYRRAPRPQQRAYEGFIEQTRAAEIGVACGVNSASTTVTLSFIGQISSRNLPRSAYSRSVWPPSCGGGWTIESVCHMLTGP
jgi:hypothetical protein